MLLLSVILADSEGAILNCSSTGYRMFDKKLRSYLKKDNKKQPFRSELFNQEQLGDYAQVLAEVQAVGKERNPKDLRKRLDENEEVLRKYNRDVLSAGREHYRTPATEWLMDNSIWWKSISSWHANIPQEL